MTLLYFTSLRQQKYLDEAEHENLVQQAKQGQMQKSRKVKYVLGRSLIKLGERLAPNWQDA
jgi:hypothetical protein